MEVDMNETPKVNDIRFFRHRFNIQMAAIYFVFCEVNRSIFYLCFGFGGRTPPQIGGVLFGIILGLLSGLTLIYFRPVGRILATLFSLVLVARFTNGIVSGMIHSLTIESFMLSYGVVILLLWIVWHPRSKRVFKMRGKIGEFPVNAKRYRLDILGIGMCLAILYKILATAIVWIDKI